MTTAAATPGRVLRTGRDARHALDWAARTLTEARDEWEQIRGGCIYPLSEEDQDAITRAEEQITECAKALRKAAHMTGEGT